VNMVMMSNSIKELLGGSGALEGLGGALGLLGDLEDSYDYGRFRLSKALSWSSIHAISLKVLILALSSLSSWGLRGLPSFWSLAKLVVVLIFWLLLGVVVALSLIATWSTIL
jgi:hypothetical protein